MYTRPQDRSKQKIRVPENYSGSAFRQGSLSNGYTEIPHEHTKSSYSDMPPQRRLELPPKSDPPSIKSEIEESRPIYADTNAEDISDKPQELTISSSLEPKETEIPAARSLFSSIFPSQFATSSHFPFGHGIGSEEMLILAMMLLVYLSGEDHDNEALLMLGLLLFAG